MARINEGSHGFTATHTFMIHMLWDQFNPLKDLLFELFQFLQRAQCPHCKRCISYSNSVRLSVCLSHRHALLSHCSTAYVTTTGMGHTCLYATRNIRRNMVYSLVCSHSQSRNLALSDPDAKTMVSPGLAAMQYFGLNFGFGCPWGENYGVTWIRFSVTRFAPEIRKPYNKTLNNLHAVMSLIYSVWYRLTPGAYPKVGLGGLVKYKEGFPPIPVLVTAAGISL